MIMNETMYYYEENERAQEMDSKITTKKYLLGEKK